MKTCHKCGNRFTSAQKLFDHLRIHHQVKGFSRRGRGSQLGRSERREEKRAAPDARQPRPIYRRNILWRRDASSPTSGASSAAAAAPPQTSVSLADASSQTATQVSWASTVVTHEHQYVPTPAGPPISPEMASESPAMASGPSPVISPEMATDSPAMATASPAMAADSPETATAEPLSAAAQRAAAARAPFIVGPARATDAPTCAWCKRRTDSHLGRADPSDGAWYCNPCWAAYERGRQR